ncbi:MAG TPA: hypothetical protein VIO33_16745 [Burkholderiaceae bacterium]
MPATRNRTDFDFGATLSNLLAVTRRYFELAPHGTALHRDAPGPVPRATPHLVELDTEFADTVPSMMPAAPPPPGEVPRS